MTKDENKPNLTKEQKDILNFDKKSLIVSASAGSGKTFVVIEYLKKLLCDKKIPLSKMLVLTFTKAAAGEIKSRLTKAVLECERTDFLTEQLDEIPLSDISTIHAFCEKLLKRYTGLTSLAQNFIVLDEKKSWSLKKRAFTDAFTSLSQNEDEDFDAFYLAFKKNKDLMLQCEENFAMYLESQKEGDSLSDIFVQDYSLFKDRAEKYLNGYLFEELKKCKSMLIEANYSQMEDVYCQFGENLFNICNIPLTENFIENGKTLCGFDLGRMSSKKTMFEKNKEILVRAKDKISSLQRLVESCMIYNDKFADEERHNHTVIALVKLYKEYRKNYFTLKQYLQALDFSDLERNTQILLNDKNILNDLQEKYEYIFIDEYQDTNPLQESFVKAVADKGRFIAVGDPKQGIYGFRNASMEIMKKDIVNFTDKEDADVLFLNGNFRSDDNILKFVNNIFEKFMTEQSVGIDYSKTGMLKGLSDFKEDGFKPVEVDVVVPNKEEDQIRRGVYSVKNDKLGFDDKNLPEVMTIASHIEKYLTGRIYDGKRKDFRDVSEGDIVVLFRKRCPLMERLGSYLENMGYVVNSDYTKPLLDNGEIASIVSFIRLALAYDDEVALASAMASLIGGFTLEELSVYKATKENSFRENVIKSSDAKVIEFFAKVDKFKNDINIRGLSKALQKLLDENQYYVYLNMNETLLETKIALTNLFKMIKNGDFEYNLQGLLELLEERKPFVAGKGDSRAITLTTIHATKGLEFPIVILAGCGDSMGKTDISPVNFSQDFGIGTNLYDLEDNLAMPSLAKLANRLSKQQKEYIDELMIFYVALTRAQNHLVLTGTISKDGLKKMYLNKTYLSLALNAFGEEFAQQLFEEGTIEKIHVKFNLVDEFEENPIEIVEREDIVEKLDMSDVKDYVNFVYPNLDANKKYKNSVSSILEEGKTFLINDNASQGADQTRQDAIDVGNAYHEALKLLPFDKIDNIDDLNKLLDKNMLSDGYYEKIDKNLLLKNILIIKDILKGQQPIKEKEFIMSCTLKELSLGESSEKVIVQGIIDLFSVQPRSVLIDYKYTSQKNPEKIKDRYFTQIKLYEKALEKAFEKNLDEKYILSLKDALLIKIED